MNRQHRRHNQFEATRFKIGTLNSTRPRFEGFANSAWNGTVGEDHSFVPDGRGVSEVAHNTLSCAIIGYGPINAQEYVIHQSNSAESRTRARAHSITRKPGEFAMITVLQKLTMDNSPMKAIELIGDIDDKHRLQAHVPADFPVGPVRLIVLLPDEDESGNRWAQDVGRVWVDELSDTRQDIYTLEDGQPVNAAR